MGSWFYFATFVRRIRLGAFAFVLMNFEDIFLAPPSIKTEKWQLGSKINHTIEEGGIALIFVSDHRGGGGSAEVRPYNLMREHLYRLSGYDFEVPICDLGELISGKAPQDTHYILQEILSLCHRKKTLPVVIGGSIDLTHSLFSALNLQGRAIDYAQISNILHLDEGGNELTEFNFLNKILTEKSSMLRSFHLLGYQKHLNDVEALKLINDIQFDLLRLSEMMNITERAEPFLRRANLVSLNCNAVESFAGGFSTQPQINGLNRREICAYMKEIGLGENLVSFGLFNFNIQSKNLLNHQLLAQMIWYLIEGVNIQKTHPKERSYETFLVMIDDTEWSFKKDSFSGLWYFGTGDNPKNWTPCAPQDYENAKRGILNKRFR